MEEAAVALGAINVSNLILSNKRNAFSIKLSEFQPWKDKKLVYRLVQLSMPKKLANGTSFLSLLQ
jgi:hypothetical protein